MRWYFLVFVCLVSVVSLSNSAFAQGKVVGKVVDQESSAPIDGAMVILAPMTEPGANVMPLMTRTDGSGAFRFDGIGPGSYRAQATKPGMATIMDANPESVITVTGNETVTSRDLFLRRGGVVSGRIVDAKGEPIAEIMVRAEPVVKTSRTIAVAMPVQTNDIGEFRLSGVPAGDFYIVATPRPVPFLGATSGQGFISTYYPGTTQLARATPVTIAAGQSVASVDFAMQSGALFSVSGVIVDESGTPLRDVAVSLTPEAGAVGGAGLTQVKPDGTFTINGAPAGTYRISVMRFQLTGVSSGSAPGGLAMYRVTSPASPLVVRDANLFGVRVVVSEGASAGNPASRDTPK